MVFYELDLLGQRTFSNILGSFGLKLYMATLPACRIQRTHHWRARLTLTGRFLGKHVR